MFRRMVVFVAMTAMVLAISAVTGSAGEITKNGKRPMVVETISTPDGDHQILHGKSACAFSGLNDEYIHEYEFEGPAGDQIASDDFGRTQNWGQIPKEVRDFLATVGAHPGDACNGNTGGEPEL